MPSPTKPLNEPDLLLYWSEAQATGAGLPNSARLLGAFESGRAISLPRDVPSGGGLALYSPAHQAVVDSAALEN